MRKHRAAVRERAIDLLAQGNSVAEVSRRTRVPRTTVWHWLNVNRPRVTAGPPEPASPEWGALIALQGQLVERVVALGPDAALADPVCTSLRRKLDGMAHRAHVAGEAFRAACDRDRQAWIVRETYGLEVAA